INLTEKSSFNWQAILNNFLAGKVSEREIATFTRLLSTMLGTGLPLTDALSNLSAQTKSKKFQEVLQTILHDVQSGVSLSESLARSKIFGELYVNLVKAGEASGKMEEALARLADTLEANLDFRGKITGAMIYPAVIVVAMIGIGIFMITNIIPKIADVYKEFGADLPLPTRILIAISDIMTHYTILAAVLVAGIIFAVRAIRKNPELDFKINNALLKFPVFGALNTEVSLAIICRTLATLLSSGVAILDALKIVAKTMANDHFRSGLNEAANYVEKGIPLSVAFKRNPDFPVMMSQLMAIGEETGTADESLERLAKFYQDSAERKVKILTTLLEPMMILLMGGMVAGLALAVLLPMFNLVNVIK
ncbi:type II secretion system F family protein, partial [Candidatus Gottesmanbacteria bacterium]|nr:type II secretion system F family protein [Candidatus Gottesmanbacteria bacterium]